MGYSWRTEAEKEPMAPRVPAGRHRLIITKLRNTDGDGALMVSQSGDPKLMIICADAEGRECAMMVTLSEKATWTLAKLLSCFDPPANLAAMEQAGVEPLHFANFDWAQQQLLQRQFWADVTWTEPTAPGGKSYSDIKPLKPAEAQPGGPTYAPPPQQAPAAAPPRQSAPPQQFAPPPQQYAPPAAPGSYAPPPAPAGYAAPPPPQTASFAPPVAPPPAPPPTPPGPPAANNDGLQVVPYANETAAWTAILQATANYTAEQQQRRNANWHESLNAVAAGRQKHELTPHDWGRVVQGTMVPF